MDPEIDAIHAEFRAGLPARVARMQELLAELRSGGRPAAIDDLRTVAHRLRGVCGSFEMFELEEPSRVIEAECKAGRDYNVISKAIDELAALIAKVQR